MEEAQPPSEQAENDGIYVEDPNRLMLVGGLLFETCAVSLALLSTEVPNRLGSIAAATIGGALLMLSRQDLPQQMD